MKQLGTIGIGLIATLAMSAVAAAGASAEAPEYGRCVKGVAHVGGFAGGTCIATDTIDNDGVYEWLPGPGPKPGFSTKMTGTAATFETVKGTKIICRNESSIGEVLSAKEIRIPSIKFNGCMSSAGQENSPGAAPEEIVTNSVTGHLRFAIGGKLKKLLDDELVPTSTPLVAIMECAGFVTELRAEATGGLLNHLVADKMLTIASNKYAAIKGEQKPSEYEDMEGKLVGAGLESNFAGGPFEEAGFTLASEQTNEEPIEANAVV
jgi:hypothetical protein